MVKSLLLLWKSLYNLVFVMNLWMLSFLDQFPMVVIGDCKLLIGVNGCIMFGQALLQLMVHIGAIAAKYNAACPKVFLKQHHNFNWLRLSIFKYD